MSHRHRVISETDLVFIRRLIAENPQCSRRRLSEKLCQAWNWVQHKRRGARHGVPRHDADVAPPGLIELPADPDPVLAAFFDYYRTPRGFHPRSINSSSAWTATTPTAFFGFPMAANIDMIAPRPIMLVAGATRTRATTRKTPTRQPRAGGWSLPH